MSLFNSLNKYAAWIAACVSVNCRVVVAAALVKTTADTSTYYVTDENACDAIDSFGGGACVINPYNVAIYGKVLGEYFEVINGPLASIVHDELACSKINDNVSLIVLTKSMVTHTPGHIVSVIVDHEIGHIKYKHLTMRGVIQLRVRASEYKIASEDLMEFEADAYAASIHGADAVVEMLIYLRDRLMERHKDGAESINECFQRRLDAITKHNYLVEA